MSGDTGGPLVHANDPARILRGVLTDESRPDLQKPAGARLLIDRFYLLYAAGL